MAPVGKILANGHGPYLNGENTFKKSGDKVEPPEGFHENVKIKIEVEDDYGDEENAPYSAMNDDEGVVIKVEEGDDDEIVIEEDEKPDVLEEVSNKIEKDGGRAINPSLTDSADDPLRSLLCKVCGKQFFRAHFFNSHMKTHQALLANDNYCAEKPHKCLECGKSYALLQHLTGHAKIHITSRYECPVCRRKFTELSNLTMHLLKTHPDEKPYKCSDCDKQFTQSSALKKHLRSHYSHTSQEDLDRIDMMFFVGNEPIKESEEPVRKKIKLEKEDSRISPVKEKVSPVKEKLIVPKERKSISSCNGTSPPKTKSARKAKFILPRPKSPVNDTVQPDVEPCVKVETNRGPKPEEVCIAVENSSEDLSTKEAIPSSLSADPPITIKVEPDSEAYMLDSQDEMSDFPTEESSPFGNASFTLKDNLSAFEHKHMSPVKREGVKEASKDSLLCRNGVPLDQVQNPMIKITKYAKGPAESEPLSEKGQTNLTSPLKPLPGSNENDNESQDSLEENENSNHSLCNGDRGLKGKAMPFLSISKNKSDWFQRWNSNKSKNRELRPSLEKPEGDHEVRFKCHRCDIFLDTEQKLHEHLMDHTGVKLCECRFCGRDFSAMTSLKRHLYYHVVGSIAQDCSRCDQTFATFRELKDHSASLNCGTFNSPRIKCFRCRKQMSSLNKLKMHLLSQCSDEPVKYYFPKKTDGGKGIDGDSENGLGKENGSSEECNDATKLTSQNEWVTQKFEKTNTVDMSEFKDLNLESDDLEALQVLSEGSPAEKGRECWSLQCQRCGHKCENAEKAKVHSLLGCGSSSEDNSASDSETFKIKVVFEENEDFQCSLNCSQCEKKIVGVEKMLLHIKEHIYEQNNITCPVLKCEKLFKDPKDFKLHLKAHTGHKPYKCSDCGKRFFLRENYEIHAQRHGILKNWSSLNGGLGEKMGKMAKSARSSITIESSIINLEIGEADIDNKAMTITQYPNPAAIDRSEHKKKKKKEKKEKEKKEKEKEKKEKEKRGRMEVVVYPSKPKIPPNMSKPASGGIKTLPPVHRPSPTTHKPQLLINRPEQPVFNRPDQPVFNRPEQQVFNRTLPPAINRPLPQGINRPLPPGINRPLPSVINRPIPVIIRPPSMISRPMTNVSGSPQTYSRAPPILSRMGHSSGGSFSVTTQGIFAVAQTRVLPPTSSPTSLSTPTATPSSSNLTYTSIASKPSLIPKQEPNGRILTMPYFQSIRISEHPKTSNHEHSKSSNNEHSGRRSVHEHSRASIQATNAELRKYPRSGRCEVCKKICSRLDKHMMVHLNQKPHLCPVCPQAFRQSEHLRRHIRARHEGNHRQFECPQCHKKLTRKDKLKEHMKNCCRPGMSGITVPTLGDSLFDMIPGPPETFIKVEQDTSM